MSNLIAVLSSFSNNIHVVTGNAGATLSNKETIHIYLIEREQETNPFIKVVKYVRASVTAWYKVLRLSKDVKLWLFFLGEIPLLVPVLAAKLSRRKVIFVSSGSLVKYTRSHGNILTTLVAGLLEKVNHILADKIVIYSERLIDEQDFKKCKDKLAIAHENFLDFDKFTIQKKLRERGNLVGYIGRLSEEKGTLNFLKAIPEILKEQEQVKFLVGGEGQLQDKIQKYLDEEGLNGKVKLPGWIGHDALPNYLNELKLLVLPSYTEGLPNTMLEAMACGTPVLATPVGAVPDVIRDGETGFIMKDNSPECIAKNVISALNHPSLEHIVKNARILVEKEFTYEAAVERFRNILVSLT